MDATQRVPAGHSRSVRTGRIGYLSPHDMFRLDLACKPIREAYGPPYLVGSALHRADYRDVDVRLILPDEDYDRLVPTPEVRTMLSVAFTAYLREATGLPVDFGVQRCTEANAAFPSWRNPLGLRSLTAWTGDAPVGEDG